MVLLTLFVTFIVVFYGAQFIWLIFSDCDLSLQWNIRFGKQMGVLSGKVVWITGASSGIGENLAIELAGAGCKLVLSSRRRDELERVKHQCVEHMNPYNGDKVFNSSSASYSGYPFWGVLPVYRRCSLLILSLIDRAIDYFPDYMVSESGRVSPDDILIIPLDLLDFESHPHAVMCVLQYYSQIDILVNNAGRGQRAAWEETSLEVDRHCLELNVLGHLSLTKSVLPHMMNRGEGHIVVTCGIEGKIGAPYSAAYSGAKHALQGWFESLRAEMYSHNIQVSVMCPGPVFSGLLENAFTGSIANHYGVKMDLKERRMEPQRCARLITFAMANQMDEVWIARQPVLFLMYFCQYFPSFGQWLVCQFGKKILMTVRNGARV